MLLSWPLALYRCPALSLLPSYCPADRHDCTREPRSSVVPNLHAAAQMLYSQKGHPGHPSFTSIQVVPFSSHFLIMLLEKQYRIAMYVNPRARWSSLLLVWKMFSQETLLNFHFCTDCSNCNPLRDNGPWKATENGPYA